jgi:hypothetical protein
MQIEICELISAPDDVCYDIMSRHAADEDVRDIYERVKEYALAFVRTQPEPREYLIDMGSTTGDLGELPIADIYKGGKVIAQYIAAECP